MASGDGRRLTRNSTGLVAARLTVAAAGLTSLPVLYDRLGAAEFGTWVLLGGVVAVLALVDLGLGAALVRQVARTLAGQPDRVTRAALGIGLLWGVLLWLLASAGTVAAWPVLARLLQLGQLAAEARNALLTLLLGLLCDGAALPWRAVLEGAQRYTTLAWMTAGTGVLGAALAVLVVRLGGGLLALAASTAAAGAVRTVLVVTAARHWHRHLGPRLRGMRRDELRELFGYGLRIQVTNASGAANLELDRFVLGGVAGPAVAGSFELGNRLLALLRLPPAIVLMAMFPMAVSRAAVEGQVWLDRFHLAATRYLTAFAAVGTALLVVSADPLIRLWLGEPVWWATATILVLAPSYALNLAAGATAIVLRVEGQPGGETGYALLSVLLNLALTWPLWRLFGPVGVPLATSCGIAAGTAYFVLRFHRSTGRPVTPMLTAVRPAMTAALAAGVGGVLAARFLPDGPGRLDAALAVATRSAVVLLIALAVLAGTGFLPARDRAELRRLVRRNRPLAATGERLR
ncbi:lipopolysaccharide biosynthesis protein [Plantactinospora sp. WMMB334]|uniref:lipopolysaccharide biosynthesis protein n=1 Tax=Plantactinospora sp. WMMB334 TaxID=3404119 RepID=UPI003B95A536